MSRPFPPSDPFPPRHIGPSDAEIAEMLGQLGYASLDELTDATVPESIRLGRPLGLPEAKGEHELIDELRILSRKNQVFRSFIGMGYHDCITPPVILRNVLENPGWYTQYTPYQAEVAQGRLEALLNFQTMVSDLTALPLANASLLDEATAAAEAMGMCRALARNGRRNFFVAQDCHPQTIAVVRTRARAVGLTVEVGDPFAADLASCIGVLVQYPTTDGRVLDYAPLAERAHASGALLVVAADLLSLVLLRPPGEFGADIAVGSTQRFGVPLGYGGPHAAFLATREAFKRSVPGRLVGVSRDAEGQPACRLALQTREQHIRRDKATSNICTAQVLLAVMASMYAVYHGPEGLKRIAARVHALTAALAAGLRRLRLEIGKDPFFDTLRVRLAGGEAARAVIDRARERHINLRPYEDGSIGVALDETVTDEELLAVLEAFSGKPLGFGVDLLAEAAAALPAPHARTSGFLGHDVFNRHHSEHEMLRYMRRLQSRDLSLTTSMIPLGSCTMKLNATSEMIPVTWPEFGEMHPFAPPEQARGYAQLFADLEQWLAEITGFAAVSLQPNAGSQGEFAGLLAIRAWHESRGQTHRNVCLIPVSAHGTNPASAVIAGFRVLPVACDERGNVRLDDLTAKAEEHRDSLGVLMITYPSTHGVFEEGIRRICEVVHEHGGQVYMDGANLNAQVGLTRPGDIGADVCHLNLHKTFCLAAGTQVALSDGTSRPIEQLVPDAAVQAWSERESGVRAASLEAVFRTGRKPCVQVTLQDGRTITCTPDHRVLTSEGWVEAGRLDAFRHRLIVGPEAVPDDPAADMDAERNFRADCAGLSLSMADPTERARTLAFFRLLGAVCSDGTYSRDKTSGRRIVRLYLGTRQDARRAIADVALLTGAHPTISTSRDVFAVRLPSELVSAVASVPGMGEPGRRVFSTRPLPDFVGDPATPLAILREFLGTLFGGDGCAPVILHLQNNPATLKPVRFSQSRVDPDVLRTLQRQICEALGRLGVEATADRLVRARAQAAAGADERPRWIGGVTVVDGLAFAERVGFRYCAHKAARLSAAAAFWRMKRTVRAQRAFVAQRALGSVAAAKVVRLGPRPIWTTAVAAAYQELASEQPVLSQYYASFAGSARLSKQHLVNAIGGTKGARSALLGVRRTHRRVLAAPAGRGGAITAVPGLLEFLAEIGAASWFNAHPPCGSYSVTYATSSQDDSVEPTFRLRVLDVRPVGERDVYDLTVAELHSFLANGAVVHNCIPHGGGGPGMGPIAVAAHLAEFLPGHPVTGLGGERSIGAVSAAPYGSPSILTIPWVYIRLMGPDGLKKATQVAILNANYMAKRLEPYYPVLFTGRNGRVAHEFILDLRPFAKSAGVEVEDVAKRLMDYGFHAPTMSFPVPGTLMVEPTESEPKDELDRFCDAMIAIREEIRAVEEGRADRANNPLKNAPHTMQAVVASDWDRPYSREEAAFPAPWVRAHKFWPAVARIDNAYGDRNLVCTCPPVEVYGA